ncbi:hypothetical protein DFH09DRAFT_1373711 [Mycena vulgaris]|nr:hypothetical protein DFH09DRAFT_1373711 [Mycena vulgaris]
MSAQDEMCDAPELPLELLHLIADDIEDVWDLTTLRLVSKTLRSVSTPRAFRVLTVNESVWSAEAISFLQTCDASITSAVREVIFEGNYSRDDSEDRKSYAPVELAEKIRRAALAAAFSGLSRFPYLQHLQFDFHDGYDIRVPDREDEEDACHLLKLQFGLFTAISDHLPPSVVSLTLNDVVPVPHDMYAQDKFQRIFRSLETLCISVRDGEILSTEDCEDIETPRVFEDMAGCFWARSIPHIIDSATALTSLTLHGGQWLELGVYPAVSFKETTFLPHLTSLSLSLFMFPPWPGGALDFILRHKSTLSRLELDDCSILDNGDGTLASFSQPWSAVLECLRDQLHVLRYFELTTSQEPSISVLVDVHQRDPRLRYHYMSHYGDGLVEVPTNQHIDGEERDLRALEDLVATVEARQICSVQA